MNYHALPSMEVALIDTDVEFFKRADPLSLSGSFRENGIFSGEFRKYLTLLEKYWIIGICIRKPRQTPRAEFTWEIIKRGYIF